ncbi:hypothetical protein [Halovulum sp. GXIMD14793]
MWGILVRVVIGVALNFVASLFYKPPPGPPSAKLKDFDLPRASEGEGVLDFLGTHWIPDSQVANYGDFDSRAIKKKAGKK